MRDYEDEQKRPVELHPDECLVLGSRAVHQHRENQRADIRCEAEHELSHD